MRKDSMCRTLVVIAFALGTLLSSGCGTIVNLIKPEDDLRAYGGVRRSIGQVDKVVNGDTSLQMGTSDGTVALMAAAVFLLFPFVDVPLSFVGDTLTYPLAHWLGKRR
jgi:uncharacterized protein YceK